MQHPQLLSRPNDSFSISDIQQFVCMMYGAPGPTEGVNMARYTLFVKGRKMLESLPPTLDALELHTYRKNFQASVWSKALESGD